MVGVEVIGGVIVEGLPAEVLVVVVRGPSTGSCSRRIGTIVAVWVRRSNSTNSRGRSTMALLAVEVLVVLVNSDSNSSRSTSSRQTGRTVVLVLPKRAHVPGRSRKARRIQAL